MQRVGGISKGMRPIKVSVADLINFVNGQLLI